MLATLPPRVWYVLCAVWRMLLRVVMLLLTVVLPGLLFVLLFSPVLAVRYHHLLLAKGT